MWRLKHQFQFTFFSSHRLFFTLLPSLLLSHYLFADPSLSRSSSLCLCSNLAVSHLVIVVPKSHFLGRNTLAEGCSAITCRITRLSLTISWETGDNGLPRTRPSWQLAPSQTLTQRVWKKRAFSNNVHYVSLSPRIVMGSCLTLSWPVTSVNKCDCYIPPYFQKRKYVIAAYIVRLENFQPCWQLGTLITMSAGRLSISLLVRPFFCSGELHTRWPECREI